MKSVRNMRQFNGDACDGWLRILPHYVDMLKSHKSSCRISYLLAYSIHFSHIFSNHFSFHLHSVAMFQVMNLTQTQWLLVLMHQKLNSTQSRPVLLP